ncbi:uncharacterized protein LOC142405541 [Mycteria americana]|uniref:uncharacterized protein LOC142405541 n=1 Tax=Mycteria americana TaxID=33587 RepID=UPI003F58D4F1
MRVALNAQLVAGRSVQPLGQLWPRTSSRTAAGAGRGGAPGDGGGLLGQPIRFTTRTRAPPTPNSPPRARPAPLDAASLPAEGVGPGCTGPPAPGAAGGAGGAGRTLPLAAGPGTVEAVEDPAGSHLAAAAAAVPEKRGPHRAGHRAAHGAARAPPAAVPMVTAGGRGLPRPAPDGGTLRRRRGALLFRVWRWFLGPFPGDSPGPRVFPCCFLQIAVARGRLSPVGPASRRALRPVKAVRLPRLHLVPPCPLPKWRWRGWEAEVAQPSPALAWRTGTSAGPASFSTAASGPRARGGRAAPGPALLPSPLVAPRSRVRSRGEPV